jgi:23S rRNA (guanosine2251-2'-O)-methyltransferase
LRLESAALPPPDLLGSDEELVAGRRPVEEAFAAGRPALRLLVVPQRRGPLEKLVLHATRLRIPIIELEGGSLTALAGFDGHQGVALVVEPREFASLDDILARAAERDEPPFVLVLDSLEDPQNVGTLLRSAEAAGVHGVIFPVRRQAPLTPAAVKASSGAVEHLLLCPVDDLGGALADLHGSGLRIAGSEADAPLTARQSDLRGPLAIVVGSEGQGLGPTVRRRCDLFMRIPMRGAVGSLNAAVAGSILLFEAVAQRDPEGRQQPRVASPWPTPAHPADGGRARTPEPAEYAEVDEPAETDEPNAGAASAADARADASPTRAPAAAASRGALEDALPIEPPEPRKRRSKRTPEASPGDKATTETTPAGADATDVAVPEAAAAADADLLPGAAAPATPAPKRGRKAPKG